MKAHAQAERIGNFLALTFLVLLGTVIMAFAAQTDFVPQPENHPAVAAASEPVRIDLVRPPLANPLPLPGPIGAAASGTDALRKLASEHRCLAEVIYFEARGESEEGRLAVAQVILHRLSEGAHGKTICDVVYEGAADQIVCQFSFACDGSLDRPRSGEAWRSAQVLAARLLAGEIRDANIVAGATFYHTVSSHPAWALRMERITQIGNHIFYRPRGADVSLMLRSRLD